MCISWYTCDNDDKDSSHGNEDGKNDSNLYVDIYNDSGDNGYNNDANFSNDDTNDDGVDYDDGSVAYNERRLLQYAPPSRLTDTTRGRPMKLLRMFLTEWKAKKLESTRKKLYIARQNGNNDGVAIVKLANRRGLLYKRYADGIEN